MNVKIRKTEGAEESTELLASSIVKVSEGFEKILSTPLKERGLVVLLHDAIGTAKISKQQIRLVLDALPRLKAWYIKT